MRICVFLGSQKGELDEYTMQARYLGRHLAEKGIGLVYGGASIGLMGEAARAASDIDGEVIGIIPHRIAKVEIPAENITELRYVETLEERENIMFNLADGFIALPGGIGTLEEIFTALTWNLLGYHQDRHGNEIYKPFGLLNTCGYYDGLQNFMQFQASQGFVSQTLVDSIIVSENVEHLVQEVCDHTLA